MKRPPYPYRVMIAACRLNCASLVLLERLKPEKKALADLDKAQVAFEAAYRAYDAAYKAAA